MTYAIDSGILTASGDSPTITVKTEYERTSQQVANAYLLLVTQIQTILSKPPDQVDQATADQLNAAMASLRSLAVNGMVVPVDGTTTGATKTQYLTQQMAVQVDMLSRSMRAVGIVNGQATIADVQQWQNLGSQGLNAIVTSSVNAYSQNNSIQALIELEYVQAGNDLLETQLTTLNNAIKATSSITDLLGQLQSIHNMIAPGSTDISGVLATTNPTLLVSANQKAIFSVMSEAQKNAYSPPITSPDQITQALYNGTVPNNGINIKNGLLARTNISPTNPEYISMAALNAVGIYYPTSTTAAGRVAIYNALNATQRTYWGMTLTSTVPPDVTIAPQYGLAFLTFANVFFGYDLGNYSPSDITPPGTYENLMTSWQFWTNSAYAPSINIDGLDNETVYDNAVATGRGVIDYLQRYSTVSPNPWRDLDLDATQVTDASIFTNAINRAFGNPIDPIVDYGSKTASAVLNSFLDIRTKLSQQLTLLDQANPVPASGRDPNSLGGQIVTVLNDMNTYVPPNLNVNADSTAMIAGMNAWILDNLDKHSTGSNADQEAAKLAGNIQTNLQNAITGATNLNDVQNQDLQRYMQIFDEFYKSASTMLSTITQIIERMAQNAGR